MEIRRCACGRSRGASAHELASASQEAFQG